MVFSFNPQTHSADDVQGNSMPTVVEVQRLKHVQWDDKKSMLTHWHSEVNELVGLKKFVTGTLCAFSQQYNVNHATNLISSLCSNGLTEAIFETFGRTLHLR